MLSNLTFILLIIGFVLMKVALNKPNLSGLYIKILSLYLSFCLFICSFEAFNALVDKSSSALISVMGGILAIVSFIVAVVLFVGVFLSEEKSLALLKRILR